MNKLLPVKNIKTYRSTMGKRLYVKAYGYKIIYLRTKKTFMIVDGSILCAIDFKSLKDAILTAKMNAGTFITGYQTYDSGVWRFIRPKFKLI